MLPQNLKYTGKVESAPAQSYRTNIAPQNGTGPYTVGNTMIFNIPTSNNLVLAPTESYLKFRVSYTNSNATTDDNIRLDACGAHGFLQRIRIFHGSNLLQDIDNYGLLAKLLMTLQVPDDANKGKNNVLIGTRPDTVVNSVGNANVITGEGYLAVKNSVVLQKTYCLNLISLLGTLCSSQYLPLFAMTSAPLRMEIQIVSASAAAFCSFLGTTTVTAIDNVEYIANFIKLSDSAMEMIYSSLGSEPLQIALPDWSNYQYSYALATTATQVNFAIPAKYSSLKSIFAMARTTPAGAAKRFALSSTFQGLSNYYFRVGSQIMPTKAPESDVEMFAEAIKAMGSMSDNLFTPNINYYSYNLSNDADAATTGAISTYISGNFFIGLDLENYVNAPKSSIFAGYNSNTDDIFLVLNHTAPAAQTIRYDAFALFDSVLVFENNTCYRKF